MSKCRDVLALIRTLNVKETDAFHLLMLNISVQSSTKLLGIDERRFEELRLAMFKNLLIDSMPQSLNIVENAGQLKPTELDSDTAFDSEFHFRNGSRGSGL